MWPWQAEKSCALLTVSFEQYLAVPVYADGRGDWRSCRAPPPGSVLGGNQETLRSAACHRAGHTGRPVGVRALMRQVGENVFVCIGVPQVSHITYGGLSQGTEACAF